MSFLAHVLRLPTVVFALAGLCVAQGNWTVTASANTAVIVNGPTSDKNVNVTVDPNSASNGVHVTVWEDADGDGAVDEGETVTSTTWLKKGDSAAVGVPQGKACQVSCGTATGQGANGTWAFV